MIHQDKLRELLTKSESETLDFKKEPHRLDNDHFKSEFIKDILSMANTLRNETAYIITGVKAYADGTKDFFGVTEHPDDNDLQEILKWGKAKVEPRPTFLYYPLWLEGKSYGVIEIPCQKDGPYFATKGIGILKPNQLYLRRGTSNSEATIGEQDKIYRWFHTELEKNDTENMNTSDTEEPELSSNWSEFYQECNHFDENRLYLFVLGPNEQIPRNAWSPLSRVPLSLVLDFDPSTEVSGVYSAVNGDLKNRRAVHLLTLGDQYNLTPQKACYWYGTRGLEGRASSLIKEDWRYWNRIYSPELRELIRNFRKASGGRLLNVVCLWYAPNYLRTICTIVDEFFESSAKYIFAFPETELFADVADQFAGHTIPLHTANILHGITNFIPLDNNEFEGEASIPRKDGTPHFLTRSVLNWLSEDLEVVHSNVEMDVPREREHHYLQGATINWDDLDKHFDADRDYRPHIQQLVERELKARDTRRLNLYHWPGAGGTTMALRIAWELRQSYPVVVLNQINPGVTVERFRELFSATELPILAIVEGAKTIPDQLENLYTEVTAQNIPVVFLSVIRRFEATSRPRPRTEYLGQNLSTKECRRFIDVYERVVPDKAKLLENTFLKSPVTRERTPFYFALTAFGKDFVGISNYVEARLAVATPDQRRIVTYLALAHYYGHKPVLPQIFAGTLGYPENIPLRLEKVLKEPQLELLVQEEELKWRPAHNLISEEILKIVLAGNVADKRNWKWSLSTWATEFIRACSEGVITPYNELVDLMRRIFILRDEDELLGTEASGLQQFSRLIEDIPSLEGKLNVLKELVDAFPKEAHFWGHLGRYYSIEMKEFDKAIEAIGEAINLSEKEDPVLYHIKGMAYRKMASTLIEEIKREWTHNQPASEEIVQVKKIVEDAKDAFGQVRRLDPDREHGYVSEIQLLLDVLDFGYRISGLQSHADFLISPGAAWYREQLDTIEDLMDRVRSIKEGERLSGYVKSCQADLYDIYDNYEMALQGWNNLLERRDVYAPPVRRQIVRAYLNRKKRDWASISLREIERIIVLMDDNLREEPGNDQNIRIWFRAIRYSSRQDINLALDRLATWKAQGDSHEAYFYLYVLHVLKAMDGSIIERERSREFIAQSAEKSRYRRNRTLSQEWLGDGDGLYRLVHYSELGEWNKDKQFYQDKSKLIRVEGRISYIKGPEAGNIEVSSCGLPAFFVPARVRVKDRTSGATKDHLNLLVSFYLGFSYDGLRAWDIEEVGYGGKENEGE